MKIVIVDDNLEEALRLKEYVQDAFPAAAVLPETGSPHETFENWAMVNDYVREIEDEFAVLFLDLALNLGAVDYNDVRLGNTYGKEKLFLVGPRIDDEEHIALLHQLPRLEAHFLDVTGNTGAHLH